MILLSSSIVSHRTGGFVCRGCSCLDAPEQVREPLLKPIGKPLDVHQRHISDSAFDAAIVRPLQSASRAITSHLADLQPMRTHPMSHISIDSGTILASPFAISARTKNGVPLTFLRALHRRHKVALFVALLAAGARLESINALSARKFGAQLGSHLYQRPP